MNYKVIKNRQGRQVGSIEKPVVFAFPFFLGDLGALGGSKRSTLQIA